MADKEITFFVLDTSPAMEESLSEAVLYIYDTIASKILRGKKQDLVGIITYHSKNTDNPLDTMSPGEWTHCSVDIEHKLFTWSDLVNLKTQLKINHDPIESSEVDLPRSLAVALQFCDEATRKTSIYTERKAPPKEKISIVLLSNCVTECSFDGIETPIVSLCRALNATIYVCALNPQNPDSIEDPTERKIYKENINALENIMASLQSVGDTESLRSHNSQLFYFEDAKRYTKDIRYDPIRLFKPTKVFDGEIRIGANINDIESQEAGLYEFVKYDRFADPDALIMRAEGYPSVKAISPESSHYMAMIENEAMGKPDIVNIKFQREHFIRLPSNTSDDNTKIKIENDDETDISVKKEEEKYTKRQVEDFETMKAFKYGSSVIPMTQILEDAMKFPSFPGIDIISFVEKSSIPPWYYQNESIMILSHSTGKARDVFAFNCLSQAMMKKGLVAIVRFVQRRNTQIKIAVLIPEKLQTEFSKIVDQQGTSPPELNSVRTFDQMEEGEDGSGETEKYGFSLIKIPFKEDEKIPNLPNLSGIYGQDEHAKKETHPTKEMVDLMDDLVDSLDLDTLVPQESKWRVAAKESEFLELNDFATTLPVPRKKGLEFESTGKKTFSRITREILSRNSPKHHILNAFLKEIAIKFAAEKNPNSSATLSDLIFEDIERFKNAGGDEEHDTTVMGEIIQRILNGDTREGENIFIPELVQMTEEDKLRVDGIVGKLVARLDIQEIKVEETAKRTRRRRAEELEAEDNGPSVDDILAMFD